jgi:excisionase family DNA binding protein
MPANSRKSKARPVTREDILTRREAIDIANAAAYLGVSHKTIRRLISSGRLPAFRVGGRTIRVYVEDVEALKQPIAVND